MRHNQLKSTLKIVVSLFVIFVFFYFISQPARKRCAYLFGPIWRISSKFKGNFSKESKQQQIDFFALQTKNHLLQKELQSVKSQLTYQKNEPAEAILAHIIYRDPSSWNSSVWIDLGENSNKKFKKIVIEKNSCVILGKAILGIVDIVGKNQSRVRLITDPELKPAVRVVRGAIQHQAQHELLSLLQLSIQDPEIGKLLHVLEKKLPLSSSTEYLAKGYLEGAVKPLWRKSFSSLKGYGFNYDFADSKGKEISLDFDHPDQLIKKGDLLVTSGLDGIFPPDFYVAYVTEVAPLREGDITISIEAKPYAQLSDLNFCFVIPPLVFDFLALER